MPYMVKPKTWWLLLALTGFLILLIWWPLFHSGMPYTHDGENHLARFANYYLALKEGQIPPRFAPNLMNRYGYPVFNYNYPLANILSLPLTIVKVNLEVTFKLLTAFGLGLGAIGVWLWLGSCNFSKTSRLLSVLAYLSAPYVLSAFFFRGSIGEVMVYGLVPWLLWWLGKLKRSPTLLVTIWGGVLIALLLMAHNVTGLIGTGIVLIMAILEWGRSKVIWQKALVSLMFGLGLSLWFWLPAILESKQVVLLNAGIQKEFLTHLVTLRQLVTSPLTFGFSTAEPVDSLSLSMGAVVLMTIWTGLILLIVSRFNHAELPITRHPIPIKSGSGSSNLGTNKLVLDKAILLILVSLILILALLFFQSTYSASLWSILPFTQIIQFPWRLMLFVPILILPVLAWVWDQGWWTTRVLIIFGLGIQIWVALNLQVVDRFHKTNLDYFAFVQSTSTQNENRPVTFTYDNIGDWQPTPTIWEGEGNIEMITWNGSSRQYKIDAKTTVFIIEPTANFLGWQTWAKEIESGQTKRIRYSSDEDMQGRINYSLPPGRYLVSTRFTQQTPSRYIGNAIFIITILAISMLLIKNRQQKHG